MSGPNNRKNAWPNARFFAFSIALFATVNNIIRLAVALVFWPLCKAAGMASTAPYRARLLPSISGILLLTDAFAAAAQRQAPVTTKGEFRRQDHLL